MTSTQSILDQAYQLIQDNQLAEARQTLVSAQSEYESDADYWWLRTYAAETEVEGRQALQRVLAINPNHIEARELEKQNPHKPQRRLLWFALVAIGLLALAALLLLTSNTSPAIPATVVAQSVPTQETEVAALASSTVEITLEAPSAVMTAEGMVSPTMATIDAITTAEATESLLDLETALADFTLTDNGVQEGDTLLGRTLIVPICQLPGPSAAETAVRIFAVLAENLPLLDQTLDAFAVQVVDCDQQTSQRTIGVTRNDLAALLDGSIDLNSLQTYMRPIDAEGF